MSVMSLEGSGRIVQMSQGGTKHMSIPSIVATDSSFPFETGERVKITIDVDNNRLIVEKREGGEK